MMNDEHYLNENWEVNDGRQKVNKRHLEFHLKCVATHSELGYRAKQVITCKYSQMISFNYSDTSVYQGIRLGTNPSNIDIIARTRNRRCVHRNPERHIYGQLSDSTSAQRE